MTDGVRYTEVLDSIRSAYDGGVAMRDREEKPAWKVDERAAFLARVTALGARRVLEVGAGTGQDSVFFQDSGLEVVATDLSAAMVECCRAKGVDARVMDFLGLDFPAGAFDAVYALNCLLHVPNADLAAVLASIRRVLRPGGLLFLGVYGGESDEGSYPDDSHDPPRFFSWRTDEQIQAFAAAAFEIVDFHVVGSGDRRFQSLTLRHPTDRL